MPKNKEPIRSVEKKCSTKEKKIEAGGAKTMNLTDAHKLKERKDAMLITFKTKDRQCPRAGWPGDLR